MAVHAPALLLAGLTFAVWCVYLGGLAAMQAECNSTSLPILQGIYLLGLPCSKVFRYWWFVFCWELVIVCILGVAALGGMVPSMRTALVGQFAIGTVLFIQASNTFLTAESNAYYTGSSLSRLRATTAGAVMTALMNAIVVLVIGHVDDEPSSKPAEADKATAAV